MQRVLQVVPRQAAHEEALSQVADRLAEVWARDFGWESRSLAGSSGRGFLRAQLAACRPSDAVLLHYVGYGYARRGAPLWLARLLEGWLSRAANRRLFVHFHEVSATGLPWRSAFWLAPLQRRVAARVGRLAQGAVSSLDGYAARLRLLCPNLCVKVLPVFSTIGEPAQVVSWSNRTEALVVFGNAATRRAIWRDHRESVDRAVRAMGAERIVEVGRDPAGPTECGGRLVERIGEVPSEKVSELLSRCRAAFFGYPLGYLDKSSAFAAACAHGVLPICEGRRDKRWPAAGEGVRWLTSKQVEQSSLATAREVASNARSWYEGHDIRHHAEAWRGFIDS